MWADNVTECNIRFEPLLINDSCLKFILHLIYLELLLFMLRIELIGTLIHLESNPSDLKYELNTLLAASHLLQ